MSTYVTKMAAEKGLRIVEATKPLTLEITSADIKAAKVKNAKCCAFARAAKREVEGVRSAHFFQTTAWLEFADGRIMKFTLPVSVRKEILSFDRSKKMEPGTYRLSAVSKSHRSCAGRARRGHKRGKRNKASMRGKVRHMTTNVRTLFEPADG